MSKKTKFVALFLVTFNLALVDCLGQMNVQIIGDSLTSKSVFFVGENHGVRNGWELKLEIVEYLYSCCGIRSVFLEYSKSFEYASSIFLKRGDSSLIAENISPKSGYLHFLKGIKRLVNANVESSPINIHCIDFERAAFIKTITYILKQYKSEKLENTKLYQYLNSIPDEQIAQFRQNILSRKSRQSLSSIHRNAKKMFDNDSVLFANTVFIDDYNAVKEILNNVVGINKSGDGNKNRDANMHRQLSTAKDEFVCFVGGFHTALSNKNSLVSRYLSESRKFQKIVIIDMICPACNDPNVPRVETYGNSHVKRDLLFQKFATTFDTVKIVETSIITGTRNQFQNSNKYNIILARENIEPW